MSVSHYRIYQLNGNQSNEEQNSKSINSYGDVSGLSSGKYDNINQYWKRTDVGGNYSTLSDNFIDLTMRSNFINYGISLLPPRVIDYIENLDYGRRERMFKIVKMLFNKKFNPSKFTVLGQDEGETNMLRIIIPLPPGENRIEYQQRIVDKIIEEVPEEEFLDFTISVRR